MYEKVYNCAWILTLQPATWTSSPQVVHEHHKHHNPYHTGTDEISSPKLELPYGVHKALDIRIKGSLEQKLTFDIAYCGLFLYDSYTYIQVDSIGLL